MSETAKTKGSAQQIAPAPAPAPEAYVQPKMLPETAIKPAEVARTVWHALAPADHTLEDVLHPSYLWRRYDGIEPGARIEIRHQLHHFLVELYVVQIDREAQAILTYEINKIDFRGQELRVADLSGAEVEQVGGLNWRVRMGNKELKGGFDTKLEAEAWLAKKRQVGRKAA